MDFAWTDMIRLLAACVAGALVGLERELHDKPAGLRTNIMICLGAALFTLLSFHVARPSAAHDPGRIAAQVVTGVGFLGAGAIIQFRGHVIGLTTAATIWLVASIGMAFGAGEFVIGAAATGLTLIVLYALGVVERLVTRWQTLSRLEIEAEASSVAGEEIEKAVAAAGVRCRERVVTKTRDGLSVYLELTGPPARIEQVHQTLLALAGVRALKRL